MTSELLGAILSLSMTDYYPVYTICGRVIDMTALNDQHVAGTTKFHCNMDHPIIARVNKDRHGIARDAVDEHIAIMDAVIRHDPAQADQAMRSHLEISRTRLLHAYEVEARERTDS